MQILTVDFFQEDTTLVAKKLLGKLLVHEHPLGTTIGRIVETEAYLSNDPAAHSFKGISERNKAMFGDAGTAYVYFIYGMHLCFNVVTADRGKGEAVLIRALEPVHGQEIMRKRRAQDKAVNLCSGPGKLTQAMGLTKQHNSIYLQSPPLYLAEDKNSVVSSLKIQTATRIGISKATDKLLRFYLRDNPHVSQK